MEAPAGGRGAYRAAAGAPLRCQMKEREVDIRSKCCYLLAQMKTTKQTKRHAKSGGPKPFLSRRLQTEHGVSFATGKKALAAKSAGAKFAIGEKQPKSPPKQDIGLVDLFVRGAVPLADSKIIAALRSGLPVAELDALQSNLDLPMKRLVPMLGISMATLIRRKAAGKLDTAESDRVVRFARLLGKAASVMESLENGRLWLTSAQVGLGGAIPLEYAETEVGAREVENLLGRIEYGVFS